MYRGSEREISMSEVENQCRKQAYSPYLIPEGSKVLSKHLLHISRLVALTPTTSSAHFLDRTTLHTSIRCLRASSGPRYESYLVGIELIIEHSIRLSFCLMHESILD